MSSEKKLPCLFCKWLDRNTKEHEELKEENRALNLSTFEDDGYLAVHDQNPTVDGHTLIISTTHYDDITKLEYDNLFKGVIKWAEIFKGVIKWTNKIKEKLNKRSGEDEIKKVYVLTMCDHWSYKELTACGNKYRYEHLHFHLVPRYDSDKNLRGEINLIKWVEPKSEELKLKEQLKIKEISNILKE